MNKIAKANLSIILIIITSCVKAPQYPVVPNISFNDVEFKISAEQSDPDSLIVFIDFQDGDGDLGLNNTETNPPYNQKNYFNKKTGKIIQLNDIIRVDDLLLLSDRSTIDTLPPYSDDYICLNWEINPELGRNTYFTIIEELPDQSIVPVWVRDTVYFQFNYRHYNFLIDFLIEKNNKFTEFDWRLDIDCSTDFNGRFEVFNSQIIERPLEGTIKYAMASIGFRAVFGEDKIKLRINIIDRAGNISNTLETPPFRLSEID